MHLAVAAWKANHRREALITGMSRGSLGEHGNKKLFGSFQGAGAREGVVMSSRVRNSKFKNRGDGLTV
jgi:hypothetical protein